MKNKKIMLLVIPALAVISLTGCNKNADELQLFDASSRFIGTQKLNKENPNIPLPETFDNLYISPLSTYHLKGKGDVPYVELTQLVNALNEGLQVLIAKGLKGEAKDDGYYIYSANKKGEMILNADSDIVKLKNGPSFVEPICVENNGVSGDYCSFRGNSIRESEKTKIYKEDGSIVPTYDSFSFKDYGFDIYKKDNNYYAPFEMTTKLLLRDAGIDCAYNGKDFYTNALGSFTSSIVKSSKGYWSAASGIYAPDKVENDEAYRFHFSYTRLKEGSETEKETVTKFMMLYNNPEHSGSVSLCAGETYDSSKTLPDVESTYLYNWRKTGDILYITVKDENSVLLGEYGIHLDETRFIKSTISSEVVEYNYNVLRFLFDNIYGLKAIKDYKNAEEFFTTCGVKSALKSTKASDYNAALAKLIGKVDDGHTGLSSLSMFTAYDDLDALPGLVKENYGPRLTSMMTKKSTYSKARVDKFAELNPDDPQKGNTDPNFYYGIKLSDNNETAIITFDGFSHEEKEIKNMKELFGDNDIEQFLVRSHMINSSANGFSAAFKYIDQLNKNSKVVKNVVIDLTNNGGGLIATMPYLAAFFTDDPVYTLKDTINGTVKEYHYKVDLNGDGTFGGVGDTYKDKFNFFMLTSGFSFSCGNCLPGMGKDVGVKIIGERSGGGVSPVGIYMDALGSSFSLSNYTNMAYKDSNGKYMQNDAGIPLDYEFPLQNGNWYDANAVHTFIKSIQN